MKNFVFLIVLCAAVPVAAYQAGPANRANFSAVQQPTTVQGSAPRAFSNYNNRGWNQGVQTQTVQTSVAGSSAKEFTAPVVGKQAAQSPQQQAKPATKPTAPAATMPTLPSSGTAGMPANMDPAAMMQQVQGMMQQGMAGLAGAQPAGQAGAMAMPAGMPDLSALMGGAMPTATPGATQPTKK